MVTPAAESFIGRHDNVIIAAGAVIAALVLLALLHRALKSWVRRLTERMPVDHQFSRSTATRLTFARRLVEAAVVAVVIGVALAELGALSSLGTAILTSSAITAAVLGFAARQTLANGIAGVMIAIAQPVRIGDFVTVEGQTGTVEDIGLVYTWLRTGADARILVPNERLASAVVRNDTVRSSTVAAEATVWVGVNADTDSALDALAKEGLRARISAMTADGIEIVVFGPSVTPAERSSTEAELRARALSLLRAAGAR
jgi:small-conductance mechanosensitive channel